MSILNVFKLIDSQNKYDLLRYKCETVYQYKETMLESIVVKWKKKHRKH